MKFFFFRQQILSRSFTFKKRILPRSISPRGDYSFALTSDIQYLVEATSFLFYILSLIVVYKISFKKFLVNSVHLYAP